MNIKFDFKNRAQGTIEYLVIIAIVVVIALVVVSLLTGFTSTGSNVSSTKQQVDLKTGAVAVTDIFSTTDGNFILELSSNENGTNTITNIRIADTNEDITANNTLVLGGKRVFVVETSNTCTQGTTITKDIEITYTNQYGITKKRLIEDVSILCQNVTIDESANTGGNDAGSEETDTTNPTVSLSSPDGASYTVGDSITFTYTPNDDNSVKDCNLLISGSSIEQDTSITSGSANTFTYDSSGDSAGTYDWNIICRDYSNNTGAASGLTFVIEEVEPVLNFVALTSGSTGAMPGITSITTDTSGNAFITGFISGSGTVFFPKNDGTYLQESANGTTLFVAKLGSDGNYIWVADSSGVNSPVTMPRDIQLDSSGNIYVAGYVQGTGTSTFNGSWPIEAIGSGYNRAFIAKLNSGGTWQWAKDIGGTGLSKINGIGVSGNNVYTVGSLSGTYYFSGVNNGGNTHNNTTDLFLSEVSGGNGDWVWSAVIGTSGEEAATSIDASGGALYIGGYKQQSTDELSLGSGSVSSSGAQAVFAGEFILGGESGTWGWVDYAAGPSGFNQTPYIVAAAGREIFITGRTSGSNTVGFDNGLSTDSSSGAYYASTKYSGAGYDGNWQMVGEGSTIYFGDSDSMAKGPNGEIYLLAKTGNIQNWTIPGTEDAITSGQLGIFEVDSDSNPNGNASWSKVTSYGSSGFGTASPDYFKIAAANDGNIFVTGYIGSGASPSGDINSVSIVSPTDYSSIFVWRTSK